MTCVCYTKYVEVSHENVGCEAAGALYVVCLYASVLNYR